LELNFHEILVKTAVDELKCIWFIYSHFCVRVMVRITRELE